METSNIIALTLGGIGFVISIAGLIVTPILNLKSKRLERRLECRFRLFQKILELWEFTHNKQIFDDDFLSLMQEINKLIQLYGYDNEIKSFRKLSDCYNYFTKQQNEDSRQKLKVQFETFFAISFNTYRKEIILDKLTDKQEIVNTVS
ncbi:MAG: hypothetical protein FWD02_03080 [Bacteroidales bacterium]|nr:hypothetical protein [Bacteroidales bacterium]